MPPSFADADLGAKLLLNVKQDSAVNDVGEEAAESIASAAALSFVDPAAAADDDDDPGGNAVVFMNLVDESRFVLTSYSLTITLLPRTLPISFSFHLSFLHLPSCPPPLLTRMISLPSSVGLLRFISIPFAPSADLSKPFPLSVGSQSTDALLPQASFRVQPTASSGLFASSG